MVDPFEYQTEDPDQDGALTSLEIGKKSFNVNEPPSHDVILEPNMLEDIATLITSDAGRVIALGPIIEVISDTNAIDDYEKYIDRDNIGRLSEDDRELYLKYLEEIQKLIMRTPVIDYIEAMRFDLDNDNFTDYIKEQKTNMEEFNATGFVQSAFSTKTQALSRDTRGTRITQGLVDPSKTRIESSILDKSITVTPQGDSYNINFNTLDYMMELFKTANYDDPFEHQTDKSNKIVGQLAVEDPDQDGAFMNIPDNHIVITKNKGDVSEVALINSYINGEGLVRNTTITKKLSEGVLTDKIDVDGEETKRKYPYSYIAISPTKKDGEKSAREITFDITVVHSNTNSILGVVDNSDVKETKFSEKDGKVYWLEINDIEGEEKYSVYKNGPEVLLELGSITDLQKVLNEIMQEVDQYEFTKNDTLIDNTILGAIKPQIEERAKQKLEVFDTMLPLGLTVISLKVNRKVLESKKLIDDLTAEDPDKSRIKSLIKQYDDVEPFILAYHKAMKAMRDELRYGYKTQLEELDEEDSKTFRTVDDLDQFDGEIDIYTYENSSIPDDAIPLDSKEVGTSNDYDGNIVVLDKEPLNKIGKNLLIFEKEPTIEKFMKLISDRIPDSEKVGKYIDLEKIHLNLSFFSDTESKSYLRGQNVYDLYLELARAGVTREMLEDELEEGDGKYIGRIRTLVSKGEDVDVATMTAVDDTNPSRMVKPTATVIPLVTIRKIQHRYKKQINIGGAAGAFGNVTVVDEEGNETEQRKRYEIGGDAETIKDLVSGIRDFNRDIEAISGA